jgi:geranylgeranyl pyrophosphate synthase
MIEMHNVTRSPVTVLDDPFEERLERALAAVEARMVSVVDSDVTVLRDASRHIITAGGKRLRPRLLMLAYIALGGTEMDAPINTSAAIELVHTASVVHDDINDHGVLRRGRPSVNAKWGRTFALLTGDFLFTKVYELMSPYGDLNVVLADATVALVEGETLQAVAVKENNFSREVYYDIIARKTAALFRAAAEVGGRLGNGTSEQVEALRQYGFNIGLAFQIIDDLLDIIGDESKLGKTANIDVEQGRGFAVAHDDAAPAHPLEAIKRRALQGDTLEQAKLQARALVGLAVEQLAALPDGKAKDGLIALAYSTVEREF